MKAAVQIFVCLFVCLMLACGVVVLPDAGSDPDASDPGEHDASIPDAADAIPGSDGAIGPAGCTWGQFTAISALNTRLPETSPTLTADENIIVFVRGDEGDTPPMLWTAEREAGAWKAPTQLKEFNDDGWVAKPTLSSDGLELYYKRISAYLSRATRSSLDDSFEGDSTSITSYRQVLSRNDRILYYFWDGALRSRERESVGAPWGEGKIEINDRDLVHWNFAVSPDNLLILTVAEQETARVYHRAAAGDSWQGPITLDGLENLTDCTFGDGALYCSRWPENDLYYLPFRCHPE